MIHVQIASQVTATGVDGIRWVLVEAADTPHLSAAPPAAVLAAGQSPVLGADAAHRPPRALSLALLKLLVMALGVGGALWLAQATLGPLRLPWWGPAGDTALPRDRLPTHTVPGAAPASPPASAAGPLLTAALSWPRQGADPAARSAAGQPVSPHGRPKGELTAMRSRELAA